MKTFIELINEAKEEIRAQDALKPSDILGMDMYEYEKELVKRAEALVKLKQEKKTQRSPLFWQVHVPNMFKEIVEHSPDAAALARPLDITGKILFVIADVAREVDNEELNSLMCRLTLFTAADPSSEDYDKRAIELIHKYDKSFWKRLKKAE